MIGPLTAHSLSRDAMVMGAICYAKCTTSPASHNPYPLLSNAPFHSAAPSDGEPRLPALPSGAVGSETPLRLLLHLLLRSARN